MRSVSAKIIAWSVAALAVSLAVFVFVAQSMMGSWVRERFEQYFNLHFEQARTAYEHGGSTELSVFLKKLNWPDREEYSLLDWRGTDLVSGADRSQMLRLVMRQPRNAEKYENRLVFGVASADRRYVWAVKFLPPSAARLAPFYILVFAVVGGLYWLSAAYIASPLKRLASVVDRIGRGDLAARAETKSRDEVGNLGRSVNAMAERIHTLLSAERQLLQDVSHELRSPLARLTFEAEMVRKTSDPDAAASRLRREVDRLSELVGALIDMARAEGEPGSVEIEDVRLSELLSGIVDDCAVEAQARGCSIALTQAGAVEVRGNTELLRRAIENVIRNAVRYTPKGTSVEVDHRSDGAGVAITVRDYGPGIPDELASRIFEPFFRVDPSRNASTGGLGLGLAIARRAIRVHDGTISAENAHPGALFRITLPCTAITN